ncbi:hypothetical protein [Candidatus Magnetomonas plexicatena]|uniref:hypothetical protein n=1 Tax=Candidatus Magnetomonas plexicatena TaxID=2552947 RepID=UPI001103C35E|nr:hypothetical protein E2O03_001805 [Nitrospirales bacterium LBB_01]
MVFVFIWYYGVNVPWWDEWDEVARVDSFLSGKSVFLDLFSQQNEHRPATQRTAMLLLAILTSYNNKIEMAFTQLSMIITLLLFYKKFKESFDLETHMIFFLPVPYLMFSLRQHESILWANQSCGYYFIFFGVLTFYLISSLACVENKKKVSLQFSFSIISAISATFSLASGLLVWPVGFLQILVSNIKTKMLMLFLWFIFGSTTILLYFYDYRRSIFHPPYDSVFKYPWRVVNYFFHLVGKLLYTQPYVNFAVGVFLVIATLLLFILVTKNILQKYLFWLTSLTYFSITLCTIALARATMEDYYGSVSDRYIPFGIMGPVSLYVIYLGLLSEDIDKKLLKLSKIVFAVLLILILNSSIISISDSIKAGEHWKAQRKSFAYYLHNYKSQPNTNLWRLLPNLALLKENAAMLEKRKYSVFSYDILPPFSKLKALNEGTYCICSLNGKEMAEIKEPVVINDKQQIMKIDGWAIDIFKKYVAGGVYIKIDDTLYPTFYGTDRVDVAVHFKMPRYRYSGFDTEITTSSIEKGIHKLSVIVLTNDRKYYFNHSYEIFINRV